MLGLCTATRELCPLLDTTNWILVRTEPNRELYARQVVSQIHNHDVYLPRFYDRDRDKICVLFPSYLFVKIVNGQFSFLKSAFGIAHVVMVGERPANVADKIIAFLRNKERDGLVQVGYSRFHKGDRVRVLSGPFINQCGVFDSYRPRRQLRVLLSAFGIQTGVNLRAVQCELSN